MIVGIDLTFHGSPLNTLDGDFHLTKENEGVSAMETGAYGLIGKSDIYVYTDSVLCPTHTISADGPSGLENVSSTTPSTLRQSYGTTHMVKASSVSNWSPRSNRALR